MHKHQSEYIHYISVPKLLLQQWQGQDACNYSITATSWEDERAALSLECHCTDLWIDDLWPAIACVQGYGLGSCTTVIKGVIMRRSHHDIILKLSGPLTAFQVTGQCCSEHKLPEWIIGIAKFKAAPKCKMNWHSYSQNVVREQSGVAADSVLSACTVRRTLYLLAYLFQAKRICSVWI